ncbi:hypothetical protein Tco_0994030 [Tanacetum coccineum]
MVPFYINDLGFTLELRLLSNFKTTGLVQPWQTLCKMFSCYLTTRVTGFDQLPLQIMQIFTKPIVSYYMTAYPEISRRVRDKYNNLEHDEMVKSIFNLVKNKCLRNIVSDDELEAKKNIQKVEEHLITEEIEKFVEGMKNAKNAEVDSYNLRKNDNQNDPTRRYSVEHWKNPHSKIFYIKKQKEHEKSKEVVYSNSKIVQIIKTYWELGYEHKFIIEIIARRANSSIVSITESDYKNLNKNDIKDLYLLIVNGKVDDYAETRLLWSLSVFIRSTVIWERVHDFQLGVESYQQKVNLTVPTITFSGIEKYKVFSIVSEPVYDIIYKNNKKEKRVMRHQEVHNLCDATLKRVLEGLKSYNNNVKHGYVTPSLSKEDVEYLQLFEEEIEERLMHHGQMRRWEMYVNGRPLGSRREHLE